jgi:site-specific DNA-methyltransferase (adenine-specific)
MSLPNPYYQDDYVTIYHGDCRELIPNIGYVDLTLTDPPYGINGGTGGTSKARGRGNYTDDFEDTKEYIRDICAPAVEECLKVSKGMIVTPGNKNLCLYPQPNSFGCLYQPQSAGMQRWGWCDSQPIFYYGISPKQGLLAEPCSFKSVRNDDTKNGHPCPKPYMIWAKLLEKGMPDRGGTVFDPFMGSGTTLRAAKDRQWLSIGIDISEEYCEIAANRMAQEVFDFT